MDLLSSFLFVGLPYAALVLFLVGTIHRYRAKGFQVSALSSQFLEGKDLFWGSVPFHFGILICFLGHVIAFLIPQGIVMWNSSPLRLLVLESTGLAFGLSALVGLSALIIRRTTNSRIRVISNRMDFAIELMIFGQIILGLWIAIGHRWGSSWFATDLAPYLWSLLQLSPETEIVNAMPLLVRLHIIGAFLIVAIFPFTRLVHLLVAPFHYILRPYQQVIWTWDRRRIRKTETPWSEARPKNN